MKEVDIETVEKDNNISPKDSVLVKKDFVKYRSDFSFYDVKGRLRHLEVEFKFPADSAETSLRSIGCVLFASIGVIPRSKEALKHKIEQFCFNNTGIEAEYTGYED